MAIQQFELFHGPVIIKLLRGRTRTLSLIEVDRSEKWTTYRINDAISLMIKYSTRSSNPSANGPISWQFWFSPDEISRLSGEPYAAVLVCGLDDIERYDQMETCLLVPEDLRKLLGLADGVADGGLNVTVTREPGKSLRVKSSKIEEPIIVSRGKLDDWVPPGR